ncbi:hypothetical protein L6R50_16190 [Myxococcota bacterium]|nr:hypothetical protein [Myxococcota bacterium]
MRHEPRSDRRTLRSAFARVPLAAGALCPASATAACVVNLPLPPDQAVCHEPPVFR